MPNNRQFEEANSQGPLQYVSAVTQRRWWVVLSACAVWALALAASLLLPPRYKSETVILIEQPKISAEYVKPNIAIDLQQRLQNLTEQVESRTRLAKLIERFHLYGVQPNQVVSDDTVLRMRSDIKIDLVKSEREEVSAFKLSYSAPSPVVAQEVTSQLTSQFIAEETRSQEELAQGTTEFLDNQLNDARKDLEQQERARGDFRSKYLGELPDQLPSNVQILSGLQNRLASATSALHQAEQQRLYLASLVGQSSKTSSIDATETEHPTSLGTSSLDQQLERMKSQLAELLIKYKPQHPDVIRLQEQIANAEKQKHQVEEDVKAGRRNPDVAGLGTGQPISPVVQLQGQLKANELEIANRNQEIKSLEAEIAQYEARLNLTPLVEQQFASVDRNYLQSRTNYESLLAKKLQSEMATNLEKRQQGQQFRMIDPPSLPQRPYWPNRLLFALGGLAGGAFLGAALCVLIQTISPRIYQEQQLTGMAAETPVLIIIPPLATIREQRIQARSLRWEIAGALVVSLVVPALTLFAHLKG